MKISIVPVELPKSNKVSKKRKLENKHYKEIIYDIITHSGGCLSAFASLPHSSDYQIVDHY